jgi:hypothetical protein
MAAEYQARETSVQAQKVGWEEARRGIKERIREMISVGRGTSRVDTLRGDDDVCADEGDFVVETFFAEVRGRRATLIGWDISTFQLLWASRAMAGGSCPRGGGVVEFAVLR